MFSSAVAARLSFSQLKPECWNVCRRTVVVNSQRSVLTESSSRSFSALVSERRDRGCGSNSCVECIHGHGNSTGKSVYSLSGSRLSRARNNARSFTTVGSASYNKWSYVHGASSVPLLGATIGSLLGDSAHSNPDKTAMIFYADDVTLTFADLLAKADALAAGLRSLGFKKGDRVGIWGPNSWQWVVTQYATARVGLILVNINPLYRPAELQFALKRSGCKGLVAAPGFKELRYMDTLTEIAPEMTTSPHGLALDLQELPDLKYIMTMSEEKHPGCMRFDNVLNLATPSQINEIADLQDSLQFDDPINIQFTSGTTGSPKGACLTHHNVVNNSFFVGQRCGYNEHEAVICCPVPLYHCFGMVMGSMQAITHGSTVVWPSPAFDPESVLKAVEKFRCTSLYGVPTMFIDMLNHPLFGQVDTSSLITGIIAGSPCPIETMKDLVGKMNIEKITVCYGSTETSPVTFQSTAQCSLDRRVSTVGKLLDHTEAKVIDSQGRVVPVGEAGEVCTRGISTMLGYWEDPEKTAQAISSEGWYHTGDLGVMTEDGYCSIVGRIKDMVIRGGENIYPLEIEQALYEHPSVKDVQVIGVPDKRLGEQVCAWIVVKENMTLTEEEVKTFCLEKMAKFKIPKYILFVEDFPKTLTGKAQKFVMREESVKMLDLE
ncbi:medium-chain acyl-CoA ligase ACSF2, mitochondrial [Aplysia californica]|uniref:Medium-chain acyl-CoA ligase ACSF2, mitochondrial n=1 Tax=Aplysia californica TaxID=6500 RepID=A0ABM0K7R2_APLCA|nr:medium-chain acyl-CoA ligase ACSF2, mitochondrial [Aplysia californica]